MTGHQLRPSLNLFFSRSGRSFGQEYDLRRMHPPPHRKLSARAPHARAQAIDGVENSTGVEPTQCQQDPAPRGFGPDGDRHPQSPGRTNFSSAEIRRDPGLRPENPTQLVARNALSTFQGSTTLRRLPCVAALGVRILIATASYSGSPDGSRPMRAQARGSPRTLSPRPSRRAP